MKLHSVLRQGLKLTTALTTFTTTIFLTINFVAANPQGGEVVGGQATISQPNSTTVHIHQGTNRAIINWRNFDIAPNETTEFFQPSRSSVTLNRVTGSQNPTQILGTLRANGTVMVVNPDGILFGRNSRIDVGGLVATTHDIKNSDFMTGRYIFNIPGKPKASIVNLGNISIGDHGIGAFVAPGIRNSGIINARLGKVGMSAANAFTLDMYGDDLIHLKLDDSLSGEVIDVATGQPIRDLVKNNGFIKADGGTVVMSAATARKVVNSVVNNSGVIEANSIGRRNGKIVLGAQTAATKRADTPRQTVKVSGTLKAKGKKRGEKGGLIAITGEHIEVLDTEITTSGMSGGGRILIGGDYMGGNGDPVTVAEYNIPLEENAVPTATSVNIASDVTINADTTDNGKGGKVIVWSDYATAIQGIISARGGTNGGDGGFVETSGKHTLDYANANIDASAILGLSGLWLLDPDYEIINAAKAATIEATLNGGTDVNLVAAKEIQMVGETITKSSGANARFGMVAGKIWIASSTIRSTPDGNKLDIFMDAGQIILNRFGTGPNTLIDTNGGYFSVTAHPTNLNNGGFSSRDTEIKTAGGKVDISVRDTNNSVITQLNLNSTVINSGSGDVTITGDGTSINSSFDSAITTTGGNIAFRALPGTLATTDDSFVNVSTEINSGGGDVSFTGRSITFSDKDIRTGGGDLTFTATGTGSRDWVYLFGTTIRTKHGAFNIDSASDVYIGNDAAGSTSIFTLNGDSTVKGHKYIGFAGNAVLNTNKATVEARSISGSGGGSGWKNLVAKGDVTLKGAGIGLSVKGQSDKKLTLHYEGGRINGDHHGLMREDGFGTIRLEKGNLTAKQIDLRVVSANGDFIGAILKQDGFYFKDTGFKRLEDRTGTVNTKGIKTAKTVEINGANSGLFFDPLNTGIFESNGLIDFTNISLVNSNTPVATDFPKSGTGEIKLNGATVRKLVPVRPIKPSPADENAELGKDQIIEVKSDVTIWGKDGFREIINGIDFRKSAVEDVSKAKLAEIKKLQKTSWNYIDSTFGNLLAGVGGEEARAALSLATGLHGKDLYPIIREIDNLQVIVVEKLIQLFGKNAGKYISGEFGKKLVSSIGNLQKKPGAKSKLKQILISIVSDVSKEIILDYTGTRGDFTSEALVNHQVDNLKGLAQIYFGDPVGGAATIIIADAKAILAAPYVAKDGAKALTQMFDLALGNLVRVDPNDFWDSPTFRKEAFLNVYRTSSFENKQKLVNLINLKFQKTPDFRARVILDMKRIESGIPLPE